jgi:hypothetical protein
MLTRATEKDGQRHLEYLLYIRKNNKPDMMAYTCNLSTRIEAGELQVQG